jgi:hypothetical protein
VDEKLGAIIARPQVVAEKSLASYEQLQLVVGPQLGGLPLGRTAKAHVGIKAPRRTQRARAEARGKWFVAARALSSGFTFGSGQSQLHPDASKVPAFLSDSHDQW